jgi:hypothetical protein
MRTNAHLLLVCACARAGVLLLAGVVSVSAGSLLGIDSIEALPDDRVRIVFTDGGTGAGAYAVDASSALAPVPSWDADMQAQINPLAGAAREALVPGAGATRFFRIVAIGGTNGAQVVARFGIDSITIDEGEGTVSIPLVFSREFQGTLSYRVSGSTTSQDIEPLSGTLQVDGLSAVILIELVDNMDLNELRYLALEIAGGPGYVVGETSQASVIIRDDDVLWVGNLEQNGNPVGFFLKLLQSAGGQSGVLVGQGAGVFPPGEFPAQVDITDTTFSLSIASVALPADSTLFGAPAELSLVLSADDAADGQSVEESAIEGSGMLHIVFPSQPQLNTSLSGPFLMVRQVIRPSSRQVELSGK